MGGEKRKGACGYRKSSMTARVGSMATYRKAEGRQGTEQKDLQGYRGEKKVNSWGNGAS